MLISDWISDVALPISRRRRVSRRSGSTPRAGLWAPSPSMPAEAAVAEASLALRSAMARIGEEIDAAFETVLALPDDPRARLYRAMRHATISGGDRKSTRLNSSH